MKRLQPAAVLLLACLPLAAQRGDGDWLVTPWRQPVALRHDEAKAELTLDNGLVRRVFRLRPQAATVAVDNVATGASLLRAVKPEALLTIDGREYPIGGLTGQPDHAYLTEEWLDAMTPLADAFAFVRHEHGPLRERLAWKHRRYAREIAWPPPGTELVLHFAPPPGAPAGVRVSMHHEVYAGLPLLAQWLELHNDGARAVRVDRCVSVDLAFVEHESAVDPRPGWEHPAVHVESDYAMHGMDARGANRAVAWLADPEYLTQVNYRRETPCLLQVSPPLGPAVDVEPGGRFVSPRTWILVHDSTERERCGLAQRRMYRTIAPWATENPILMHVRSAEPAAVRLAIEQCAEAGFEMVILTFGSGFDIENEDPAHLASLRELADFAHARGVELGGYSLLASRRVSDEHDAIHPDTGRPGGAIFGNSPCLESAWGRDYFRKLRAFYEATGMDLLEHDGSYPGDVCASTAHPGHRSLDDSQWQQWRAITAFYGWCRARGICLNVPDWYFLSGSNKTGMGYRETNWSLPRAQQIVHARQNIYDGTWTKTPSMGWMFVPLVEYHGGGAAATLEPLAEHLDAYEAHLANNFGAGVQACYRGPRLFDTDETKALVQQWVTFYKRHRRVLDGDVIHVRRADGRDLDSILHVDPQANEGDPRALAMVYNPLSRAVRKPIALPLYYAGVRGTARVRVGDRAAIEVRLDERQRALVEVELGAGGAVAITIE
jgi:hypothetical protein